MKLEYVKEIHKCNCFKVRGIKCILFIKIFLKVYAYHTKVHKSAPVIFGIFVNSLNAYDKTKHYTYFVCLLIITDFVSGIWL